MTFRSNLSRHRTLRSATTPLAVPLVVLLVVTLAVLLAASPAFAQKGRKSFGETTDVVVVEVPVTVVGKDGEPVRGLTAEDFEVIDGKKEQDLVGFEVIDLTKIDRIDPMSEERREIPVAARRHFLMLFDLAFSQPESLVRARWAARDLIDNLHPTDLAGVAVYTNTRGANLLLNFTSDRRQLELAIETLGVPELVDQKRDPLNLVLGDVRQFDLAREGAAGQVEQNPSSGATGRDRSEIEQVLDEQINETISRINAAERASARNNISALTGNLEALADLLASIDGRKHLVYFSEGVASEALFGQAERSTEQQLALESGTVWESGGPSSDELFGSTQSQNELESMIEALRRSGTIVQSVDIGGLRTQGAVGERGAGEDSLLAMAKDTGGDYFRNFNDLGEAMDQMLERNSVTYLLAFQPKKLKLDGDYHRLKVKLKNGSRGTRLSHRLGYYAPLPYDEISAQKRQLTTAELILSDAEGGPIGVSILNTPFPVPGENAYVPLLLEISGGDLLAGGESGTLPLELYAYAVDAEGQVRDFFAQNLGMDLAQIGPMLKHSGVKYWGHFDLPPGTYTARILVRDARDGRATLAKRPFRVPSFEDTEAALLPAMFPEPPGNWVLIREPEERRREVAYPFVAAGQPYVPAVMPTVPKKGEMPFYFHGVNLEGNVEFSAEVVDTSGETVRGVEIRLDPPTMAEGVHSAVAQLQTRGLEPGRYTLVASVTDGSGESRESKLPFIVR